MAYTAVPTVATGDTWTAANHNTYIKNNFAAGVPDIFTTKGDIAVATAANTAVRLAVGTNNQFLISNSAAASGLSWGSGFVGALYTMNGSTGNSALADSTDEIIDFNVSSFDTDSAVTTGTSWKFTVPTGMDGYYLVSASLALSSTAFTANQVFRLSLYKGGVLQRYIAMKYAHATASYTIAASGSTIISLAATNYIDIRGYQDSGGAANINSTSAINQISIARII